jgi:peptidoglycan/xylan/chitin deacetylase (PgdA/CDA1 family)
MFHRLHPNPQQRLNHDNYFSERGLIVLLEYCLRTGIDIVNINEAVRRLRDCDERFFVVLTFDDGYRDNYTSVLPILNKFAVPFTVFVCSSIIERTFDYWWGGLISLFRSHDEVDIEAMEACFTLNNDREREAALNRVTSWVKEHVELRSAQLKETFLHYGISPADLLDQDAMTEDELRRLSESSLVTVGGHGLSHRPLASLSVSEARHEIEANRVHLERVTGQPVVHFAYPFGDSAACNWREADLVRQAGYQSAFTTRTGNLFSQHAAVPFMLPRNAMHPRHEEVYHAEAKFAGVHRFIQSAGGPPVHPDTIPPAVESLSR